MLQFDEEKHKYTLDGRELISVTTLMRKHNLAPNYDGVPSNVLRAKAERGTLIHKEIEDYIKNGEIGFTNEMMNFMEAIKTKNINVLESELKLHNDIVAGICDLVLSENNTKVIADIKTTATLHKESVSWQLSIYAYLYWNTLDKNNELAEKDYSAMEGQAFHFEKNGFLNIVDIKLKPYAEIEKLMNCERTGVIYSQELSLNEGCIQEIKSLEQLITDLDKQVKEAKAKQENLKQALLKEMEARALTTFENEGIKITYVKAEKSTTTIDVEKMNKDIVSAYEEAKTKYDEEAKKYTTTTKVYNKPYLRISIKGAKKDE